MRSIIITLSAAFLIMTGASAKADHRVAFVVGNSTYSNAPSVPNAAADAKAMATTLRGVGFDVVEGSNLTRPAMTDKLLEFGRKAQDADLAVFYYAGHAISLDGSNYLLPVDADLRTEMDARLGAAVNVDNTVDQTMGSAKVKLIFLDACRDNPFSKRIQSASASRSLSAASGLSQMKSAEGTLIALAAGPSETSLDDQSGAHSAFSSALIANIATPGIEIQQAMTLVRAQVSKETHNQQMPWGQTSLTGAVYLNPSKTATATAAAITPVSVTSVAPVVASEAEVEFWRSVRGSNKLEELNAYLTNYPNGQFRSLALARVAALTESAPAASQLAATDDPNAGSQVSEDQMGLTKTLRRDVQQQLTALGLDTKLTGVFDGATRAVIKRWQAAHDYIVTGFLNDIQYKTLMAGASPSPSGSSAADASDNDDHPARKTYRTASAGGRQAANPFAGPQQFFGAVFGGRK